MGVAGTGKSTLARELIRHVCAVYLDNNHITDAFFPNTRNSLEYQRMRPQFYRALYTIAVENLRLGNPVLLDAPHIKEVQTHEWQAFIKRLVKRTRSTLIVLRCCCSEKSLRTRIKRRGEIRDEWKLRHWDEFLNTQPIETVIPWRHLDLNTEQKLRANVAMALRYIKNQVSRHYTACESEKTNDR